jgi:hypothetical protein
MDALALLCTLHADGPATLKNLRQAGCGSLEAIEAMEEGRLSRLLGGPPAVARRFVREARHLRERLSPNLLDREETHADGPAPAMALAGADGRSEIEAGDGTIQTERDPMAEVLEAWRERDQDDAASETGEGPQDGSGGGPPEDSQTEESETTLLPEDEIPPRPIRARPEFEFGTELAAAVREITSAVTPDGSEGDGSPLPRRPLEGAEADLAHWLAGEGECELRELGDREILALSQRLGVGYTRILRIVQLARRSVTDDPGKPAATPAPNPSPTFGAGVVESTAAPVGLETSAKLSPADRPRRSEPSILELEWNLEIQPKPPPHGHALPERSAPSPRHESAGGPFA